MEDICADIAPETNGKILRTSDNNTEKRSATQQSNNGHAPTCCKPVFRRASVKDKEGILDIGIMYWGMDYLPHLIHHYLTHPKFVCFVGICNNTTVAYEFYQIMDEGCGVLSGGLRVHPDYRGLGIADKMEKFGQGEIRKMYPKCLQNHVFTCFDDSFQRKRLQEHPEQFQLLQTRNVLSLTSNMKDIRNFVLTYQMAPPLDNIIHNPTREEFIQALTDDTAVRNFFHNEVMMLGFKPYRPVRRDLSYVYDIVHVSWSKNTEGSLCTVVSTHIYPIPLGLNVSIDLHGQSTDDAESHIVHAFAHVCKAYPHFSGEVHLLLGHPESVTPSTQQRWQKDVSWQPGVYSRLCNHSVYQKLIMKWSHS